MNEYGTGSGTIVAHIGTALKQELAGPRGRTTEGAAPRCEERYASISSATRTRRNPHERVRAHHRRALSGGEGWRGSPPDTTTYAHVLLPASDKHVAWAKVHWPELAEDDIDWQPMGNMKVRHKETGDILRIETGMPLGAEPSSNVRYFCIRGDRLVPGRARGTTAGDCRSPRRCHRAGAFAAREPRPGDSLMRRKWWQGRRSRLPRCPAGSTPMRRVT